MGHDLHDKLGQHLTGTALAAQVLKEKLAARCDPETDDAEKLVRCLEEGIDFTRNLARGFFSPELKAEGLVVAVFLRDTRRLNTLELKVRVRTTAFEFRVRRFIFASDSLFSDAWRTIFLFHKNAFRGTIPLLRGSCATSLAERVSI